MREINEVLEIIDRLIGLEEEAGDPHGYVAGLSEAYRLITEYQKVHRQG